MRQQQWAEVCRPYAMMSVLAYENHKKKEGEAADVENATKTQYRSELAKEGWRMIGDVHRPSFTGKRSASHFESSGRKNILNPDPADPEAGEGLYMQIWENKKRQPHEIVLAFEGSNKDIRDWFTNTRPLRILSRRRHADQYEFARPMCADILDHLVKSGREGARIVTTGHSLGGGLAQCIFYANARSTRHPVDQAIVFNSSPVTGYHDFDDQEPAFQALRCRDSFPHFRIVRVYEAGEILQNFRAIADLANPPDGLIQNVKFQSKKKGGAASQHSMVMLADTLRELSVSPPPAPVTEKKPMPVAKDKDFVGLVRWQRDTPGKP